MQFRRTNDQIMAYRHRPDTGPTLVFVNSLGSDQSLWDEVLDRLPGRATLTHDLPGHGLAALRPAGPTIDDMARDLTALLDDLGIGAAVLCGCSIGGMIAQTAAASRPDLVRGAILMNTAGRIGGAERWTDRIAKVEGDGLEAVADDILANWFAPGFRGAHPDTWTGYRTMLCRTPDRGYIALCETLRDTDLTDMAVTIACPVLCIAGEHDRSVPPDAVVALATAIPGARVETLATGHLPCLEAPAALAALIDRFIAALPGFARA